MLIKTIKQVKFNTIFQLKKCFNHFFFYVPTLLTANVPALGEVANFVTEYFLLLLNFLRKKNVNLPHNSQSRKTAVGGCTSFPPLNIYFKEVNSFLSAVATILLAVVIFLLADAIFLSAVVIILLVVVMFLLSVGIFLIEDIIKLIA